MTVVIEKHVSQNDYFEICVSAYLNRLLATFVATVQSNKIESQAHIEWYMWWSDCMYRQLSNISSTKFQNVNVSRLVLPLHLLNPLKPGVKSRMKI